MYIFTITMLMVVLPVASIVAEHLLHPSAALLPLVGRWFVFWGVGVRLTLAGFRQLVQPEFTARTIFETKSEDVLPIVRELGCANIALGAIALLSIGFSTFVLPSAIAAGLFFGIAGLRHVAHSGRTAERRFAMVTDLLLALVLLCFAALSATGAAGV